MRPRALALAVLVACGACSEPRGEVVFGVTSDYRAGVDLHRLEVTTDVGGEVSHSAIELGSAPGSKLFPIELPVRDLPTGEPVAMQVAAYTDTSPADTLVVERRGATTAIGSEKLLFRLHLSSKCELAPGAETCDATKTCASGLCIDPFLAPEALEPYAEGWSKGVDRCKPAGAGAPEVAVGAGQADYLPAMDFDEAQLEAGPQGGHHIWLALRARNLKQSGTRTVITGSFPDLGLVTPPLEVIFTLLPDEGDYCTLDGLRFQLDGGGVDVALLLGQKLEVTATMKDADGAVGVGKRWVTISDAIVEPI